VKGCTGYPLGTALPKSLDIAHYPQAPAASTPARELLGCVIDKLSFMFDSNLEPMMQFSGPAQGFSGSSPNFTPQAQPGGFTTVGAENAIPSGLTGYFQLGGTLYEIEKMQIDIDNAMDLQNTALGTNKPTAYFRKGKRIVTFKIDAKVSDDLTLWTPSLASRATRCMIQIGTASTKMFGLYMPAAGHHGQPGYAGRRRDEQLVVPGRSDGHERQRRALRRGGLTGRARRHRRRRRGHRDW
jgi:hypothetical protein